MTSATIEMKGAAETAEREGAHRILYLTFDGVMDPLGRSQILSYLLGLTQRGYTFTLVSLESPTNLADLDRVRRTEETLRQSSIEWIHLPYHSGGVKAVQKNLRSMTRAASKAVRGRRHSLAHARTIVPAMVAYWLCLRYRLPHLFDTRAYWIEEKRDEGTWFTNRRVFSVAKWLERRIYRSAAGVVTLTGVMAEDLRSGILADKPDLPIAVIPTCADFDHFNPQAAQPAAIPAELHEYLKTKLVIGMIGAINASYCIEEALGLFRFLKAMRPDAHLLWVTRQTDRARALLRDSGIEEGDYSLVSSGYEEMPEWMRCMQWGFLLLNETFAKRASMPTKLAEMLACGVRPIQYGCNREVTERVRTAGSGITLEDVSEASLRYGAQQIADKSIDPRDTLQARERAREWFALESGIERYDAFLRGVLAALKVHGR
jgi:glycosyltransferase involved in cell wall biosynthesis